MTVRRFTLRITTDDSGDAEVLTQRLFGHLVSIHYVKDDFDDGVDFVVTNDRSGETIWSEESVNASATRYPRAATHTTAGAAALYDTGGEGVLAPIAIGGDRLKVVVADGGDTNSGTVHILIDG